ncbi:ssDNA-binding protein [Gordonia phage RedWattleHog]|uniref:SsDNA binding protein n=1 Tax=Gordonia phage Stormageddon TaxID=2656541 RepID=A0A649VRJ9_9CAUD|nr:single strand DNA binding protein [Gordonia phage Stormageddon]QGJ94938.1 ssDNA binding protein [Gordonia phage Stormageddon]QLF83582.1 ssDNA-binding protein [Gordonia phage RedWattleHog]
MGIGMGAAQAAGERKAAQGGGDFLPMVYWKDDKSGEGKQYKKIVRFLTDDVITAKIYGFVKGGPEGKGRDFIDPASLVDDDGKPLFEELAGERDYFRENNIKLPTYKGDLKDAKDIAQEQTLGLVVLREEYTVREDRNGREVAVVKMRDLIEKREYETKDGEKKTDEGQVIGVVKQGYKNFWSTLAGYYNRYGTICDRDYEITRKGNGTDTTYSIIRLDKDEDMPDVVDGESAMAHYQPRLTLKDWVVPKAKYDAAKEWLEGTSTSAQDGGNDSPRSEAKEDSGPVREASGSAAADLRKELEDYKA